MQKPLALVGSYSSPRTVRVVTVVLGSVGLALSAKIQVPFWPVPMTLETLAVLTFGGLFGARLASSAVFLWLVEGAAGFPVFAGKSAGPTYFLGPTAGYLIGFLLAAALVGWIANPRLLARPWLLFSVMLSGVVVIYLAGVLDLAHLLGWRKAVQVGLLPFLAGDLTKAALAAAVVTATHRVRFIRS